MKSHHAFNPSRCATEVCKSNEKKQLINGSFSPGYEDLTAALPGSDLAEQAHRSGGAPARRGGGGTLLLSPPRRPLHCSRGVHFLFLISHTLGLAEQAHRGGAPARPGDAAPQPTATAAPL